MVGKTISHYEILEKLGVGPFDFTPPNLPLEQS